MVENGPDRELSSYKLQQNVEDGRRSECSRHHRGEGGARLPRPLATPPAPAAAEPRPLRDELRGRGQRGARGVRLAADRRLLAPGPRHAPLLTLRLLQGRLPSISTSSVFRPP